MPTHFRNASTRYCLLLLYLTDISTEYRPIANSFDIQVLENGTLFIDSVDKKDSGLYLCHASNGIGSDLSKIIRLQVHGKNCFSKEYLI